MTIPELMYGARRYDVRGYLGDDFTHLRTNAGQWVSMSTTFAAIANRTPAWSVVWLLLLILFGLLAIGLPLAIFFSGVLFIGWLLILCSAIQVLHAFQPQDIASLPWKLAVALLFIGAGIYLLADPILGISRLNLAIGLVFTAEAVVDFLGYIKARNSIGSSWILLDGIGTLFLGLLIWRQWPSSSARATATLIGISMLVTGIIRLMITLVAREQREPYMG
jgi:uncharacterized membrane protein HdeD (DUF308 family)